MIYFAGDEDYLIPPNQIIKVIFPAGTISASFDVNIIDDLQLEDSETFHVSIDELSVPFGVTLGFIKSATVTILDDDSK